MDLSRRAFVGAAFLGFTVPYALRPSGLCGQEPSAPSEKAIDGIERRIVALMNREGIPGLSIAIGRRHELWYTRGFGLADLESQGSVAPETRFRTASIAKSLTAVAVLSLVEEGVIDLDRDVRQYCPEYPQKEWTVTTRQLLGHLAGVRHYKNRDEASATQHYFSLQSALATFRDDPLLHPPGSKFLYSSFGYNLLGSVVEGAAKRSFVELLRERVIQPSGMTHTDVDDALRIIPGRSRGYIRLTAELAKNLPPDHDLEIGELYQASLHDTSMKIPGGGLLSTSQDLVRFLNTLHAGGLLSEASRQTMWQRQQTSAGEFTEYGLGWRVDEQDERKVVSHTGGQAGTSTAMCLIPDTGTCVAIMCNLQYAPLLNTALAIADAIDDERL